MSSHFVLTGIVDGDELVFGAFDTLSEAMDTAELSTPDSPIYDETQNALHTCDMQYIHEMDGLKMASQWRRFMRNPTPWSRLRDKSWVPIA